MALHRNDRCVEIVQVIFFLRVATRCNTAKINCRKRKRPIFIHLESSRVPHLWIGGF